MNLQFRLTIPVGKTPILRMPQLDWYEGHAQLLAALAIKDAGPVLSQAGADRIRAKAIPWTAPTGRR